MIGVEVTAVFASFGVALVGAFLYERHHEYNRPPIGVISKADVGAMAVLVVVAPFLYLLLPKFATALLLGGGYWTLMSNLARAVIGRAGGLFAFALIAADLVLAAIGSPIWLYVNNALILVAVSATAMLWAQAGMRAAHLGTFALFLCAYDLIATGSSTLTALLLESLEGRPFFPLLMYGDVGLGYGDLLFVVAWPLVLRRAYGERAAAAGVAISFSLLAALAVAFPLLDVHLFPVMVVLGPAIALQALFLRRRWGRERRCASTGRTAGPGRRCIRTAARLDDRDLNRPSARAARHECGLEGVCVRDRTRRPAPHADAESSPGGRSHGSPQEP